MARIATAKAQQLTWQRSAAQLDSMLSQVARQT